MFNDVIMVLDSLVSSNLSDKEFIEGKYRANRGQFDNAVAARVNSSFGRDRLRYWEEQKHLLQVRYLLRLTFFLSSKCMSRSILRVPILESNKKSLMICLIYYRLLTVISRRV